MSIHVLVAGLPRLLSEVLSAGLSQSGDLSLVGLTDEQARPGSHELDAAIDERKPDAAIVGMRADESAALGRTQLRHRRLAIFAVSPDGASAWKMALRTELRPVESPSPTVLRAAIKDAVAANRGTQRTNDPSRVNDLATEPEGT